MFATLLKYEFRRTKNILLPINLGALLLGSFGYILVLLLVKTVDSTNDIWVSFSPLIVLLWYSMIFMLALLSLAVTIILCLQFYREKFTDQGYLTFTLPVSTHQILLSSYLNFFIWSVINTLVTLAAYALMFTPLISLFASEISNMGLDLSYLWALIKEELTTIVPNVVLMIVSYTLMIVTSVFYGIALPYLSITLACSLVKKAKLLLAVGIGYGLSMVMNLITVVISITEGIITGAFLLESGSYYALGSISLIITSVLYIAFTIGGYFLMHHLVKNKLNL